MPRLRRREFIGTRLFEQPRSADAHLALLEALTREPDLPETRLTLALLLRERGRYAEAARALGISPQAVSRALIRTGYRDQRSIVCASKAEALRVTPHDVDHANTHYLSIDGEMLPYGPFQVEVAPLKPIPFGFAGFGSNFGAPDQQAWRNWPIAAASLGAVMAPLAAQAQTAPAMAKARMTAGPARSAPTPVSV